MRLRDLPNLGPSSEAMLIRAGVTSPDDLDRLGAAEAFRRVVDAGGHPSLNLVWALEGALVDCDWRDLPAARKDELRREVDRAR